MNKSTLLALAVFAALAAAAVSTMSEKPERGVSRLDLSAVDPAATDTVLLGDGEEQVRIEKKNGYWVLDGKRADGRAVDRAIEALGRVRSGDLASRNPDRFAELEVDDEKGAHVQLVAGGKTTADVRIGGAANGGSYLRVGDEVFSAPGLYRAVFARDRGSWLEKRAFLDDEFDAVGKVTVDLRDADPYTLAKVDGAWALSEPAALPEGQRFDPQAAERLVRAIVGLRAQDVLDDPAAGAAIEDPSRITFEVSGGSDPRVLELASSEDGTVRARASTRNHLLSLTESSANGVGKALTDLRDWTIVSLSPPQASKLEIASGDMRLTLEKTDDRWSIAESSEEMADDFQLDSLAVTRRLSAVSRLRAISEADAPVDPSSASASVRVTQQDGSVVALSFAEDRDVDGKELVEAVGNIDDRTYLVTRSDRDRLLAGVASFERSEAAPGGLGQIDPAALSQLPPEVRDSLLKQMAEERQRQELMQRVMEAEANK